ncbi:MAG: extracellular solute-binding protein [Pseudomonadota bacterium]
MSLRNFAFAGALSLAGTAAMACDIENTATVAALTPDVDAWGAMGEAMSACGNVRTERDPDVRSNQRAVFAATPSPFQIGGVSNDTITPLLTDGTIRPLDDLVAKHGQALVPNQLISVNGQTMAVAMMVNTQHLMYRKDIFDDLGLAPPVTWADALAAAEAIRRAGVVDFPMGATMASGWDLAQEFVNMFLGYGGTFYGEDSQPQVNSEAGLKALETMRAITAYLDPGYLSSDSDTVQRQLQQGRIAMANLWSSRSVAMDDPEKSQVVGQIAGAPAPRATADGPPATTLWWDGIVIAKNAPDATAEAAFRVAMEALDTRMVEANNDAAIWLIPGYRPTRLAEGAIATATATPQPVSYPSTLQMGLMHAALGAELPAFFTGQRSAADTLAAVEAAYLSAAQEAGLVKAE